MTVSRRRHIRWEDADSCCEDAEGRSVKHLSESGAADIVGSLQIPRLKREPSRYAGVLDWLSILWIHTIELHVRLNNKYHSSDIDCDLAVQQFTQEMMSLSTLQAATYASSSTKYTYQLYSATLQNMLYQQGSEISMRSSGEDSDALAALDCNEHEATSRNILRLQEVTKYKHHSSISLR